LPLERRASRTHFDAFPDLDVAFANLIELVADLIEWVTDLLELVLQPHRMGRQTNSTSFAKRIEVVC